MVGWHHWLNEHKSEQAPEDEGDRSLAGCSLWGHKELDTTEWLNNNIYYYNYNNKIKYKRQKTIS